MIIANKFSFYITKIAGYCGGITAIAVTIWPFIFLKDKWLLNDKALLRHETQHLVQWKRYLIVGFPFVYCYYHFKYGYSLNPLEIEARNAQSNVFK